MISDSRNGKQILSKSTDRNPPFVEDNIFQFLGAKDNTPNFSSINGNEWFKMRQLMHSKLIRALNIKCVNNIINQSITNELEPELNNIIKNQNGKNVST